MDRAGPLYFFRTRQRHPTGGRDWSSDVYSPDLKGAPKALEFYKRAFGARETMRFTAPDGEIGHAEIRIGDSVIMLADEYPDMGYRSPQSIGGTPPRVLFYEGEVDRRVVWAIPGGGEEGRPLPPQ